MKYVFVSHGYLNGGKADFDSIGSLSSLVRFAKLKKLKVAVETNGSKLDVLQVLLEQNLVDSISLDFKAPLNPIAFQKVTKSKTFFKHPAELLSDFKQSLFFLLKNQHKIDLYMKTMIVPGLIYRKEDILSIAGELGEFTGKWFLFPILSDHTLVSKRLQFIAPPSKSFLLTLKETINNTFPKLNIVLPDYD